MSTKTKKTVKGANKVRMSARQLAISEQMAPATGAKTQEEEIKDKSAHRVLLDINKRWKEESRGLSRVLDIYTEFYAEHWQKLGVNIEDLTPAKLTPFMSESEKIRHDGQQETKGYQLFSPFEIGLWVSRFANKK